MQVFAYEPETLEREFLKVLLQHEGYRAEIFQSEDAVLGRARKDPNAMLIISLHDPARGLAICQRLREVTSAPILALSKRLDEDFETTLYEEGVDEVIVRPIRPRLFVARLENLRRRSTSPVARSEGEEKLVVGSFQLLPARLELRKHDQIIHLTPLQCRILYHLMANAGQAVPRERLEDKVWGYDSDVFSNAVKTHIWHLRQKLEDNPLSPCFIKTIKGVGYSFQKPAVAEVPALV